MAKIGYSFRHFEVGRMSRAYGRELPISPKKTRELCGALRGLKVDQAREYLERVMRLEQAVPFKRHNRWVAHKPGIGPGRYPVKPARHVLKVLKSAEENARDHGLEPEDMVVKVIAPHRGSIRKGRMPRAHGRSTPWNQETVNLEVVLEVVS